MGIEDAFGVVGYEWLDFQTTRELSSDVQNLRTTGFGRMIGGGVWKYGLLLHCPGSAFCKIARACHEVAGMNASIPGTNGRLCAGMISTCAINDDRSGET